ncbi:MAG: PilZ domain-containing protein [Sphingomonas sp.]|uniref:PilZ domain-containing protein n=1 Tax=Sphingomonas sp. TaxID=28214 RepID=UPI0025D01749|nr:PilZ domain-containing protein [Sphingomonas sp.]MBY0283937.1 PilZ domain-containing protein [Sphingomonas sp.]
MPPPAFLPPLDHQRREGERARVMMVASIRERSATAHDAVINDLSRQGCQVSNIFLRTGKPVWVRFGHLAPIEATVMWARGDQSGIRFNQPLHPAVLDHVAAAARVR